MLPDPVLNVSRCSKTPGNSDNWETTPFKDRVVAAGPTPIYPSESGVVLTLDPSEYTAILSGADGGVGNAIVAVWDLD